MRVVVAVLCGTASLIAGVVTPLVIPPTLPDWIKYAFLAGAGVFYILAFAIWLAARSIEGDAGSSQSVGERSPILQGGTFNAPVFISTGDTSFPSSVPETATSVERHAESLPGISIHMVARVHFQNEERRKYLVSIGLPEGNSASLFLTAENRFTFSVTDKHGETYSVETATGRKGIPYSEWVILSGELGLFPHSSVLRISVDGKTVAERDLPFVVRFDDYDWVNSTSVAAAPNGEGNAKLDVGSLLTISRHLTDSERSQLFQYWSEQWKIAI